MTHSNATGSLASNPRRPDLHVIPQPNRKPRIGFIVCEAGGGHKSAARALSEALHQAYPDTYETVTVAVEDMIGPIGRQFGTLYSGSYNLALQGGHYWLEPVIYKTLSASRKALLPFGIDDFRKALKKLDADFLVMLIHGSHEVLAIALQRDGHIPNMTVITDAVSIRPSWVHPHCDEVVVSTEDARKTVIGLGIQPEKIKLIGHPLDPGFAQPTKPRHELRRRYFLQPDRFTIMMMMGGTGGRNIYRFSKALVKSGLPVQIVACCGTDKWLLHNMTSLAANSDMPIKAFSYTKEISNLMALSDLLITKPGPGTIMEALARDLPMVIDDSNYTMWQEAGNVDFVRRYNLGRVINHIREFMPVVRELVEKPEVFATMREAVGRHKCTDASAQIVKRIHERLSQVSNNNS